MAALDTAVYSPHEFKIYIKPEAAVGTSLKTAMQQINVNGIVQETTEIIKKIDIKSGSAGRILQRTDVITNTDMAMTTISIPFELDRTSFTVLVEAVTGIEADANSEVDVPYNYKWTELATGAAPATTNTGTYTVCMASPIANKSIYVPGCLLQELTITFDSGTDGGLGTGTAVFVSKFDRETGQAAPTTPTTYGTDRPALCDFTTRSIAGDDVILSKIEFMITNPALFLGCSGGEPELVARGAEMVNKLNISMKEDVNTVDMRELYYSGADIVVNLTGTDIEIAGSYAKLISDPAKTDADGAVFADYELQFTATTSGTVVNYKMDLDA